MKRRLVVSSISVSGIVVCAVFAVFGFVMLASAVMEPNQWFFWVALIVVAGMCALVVPAFFRDQVAWVDQTGLTWRSEKGRERLEWSETDTVTVYPYASSYVLAFRLPTGALRMVDGLAYPATATGLRRAEAQAERIAQETGLIHHIMVHNHPELDDTAPPRRALET